MYLESFLNLRTFLTLNHLERSETQIPEGYEVLAKKRATETCERLFQKFLNPKSREWWGMIWSRISRQDNNTFILTEKTKARDTFSRIYKSDTIITEMLSEVLFCSRAALIISSE